MSKLLFSKEGWDDYLYWQGQDRKTLKRINALFKDIDRNPFDGTGKPEPLKGEINTWSRRIDEANRIVYKVNDEYVEIVVCKGHYDD